MATRQGRLEIVLPFDSPVLCRSLPIEVRNQHHAIVATLRGERSIKLPEGLYSITAVLDTGQRVTRPVHVKFGETTRVSFRSEDPPAERQCTSLVLPSQEGASAFVSTLFSDRPADEATLADLLQPPQDASGGHAGTRRIWVAAASPNLSLSQSDDEHMIHVRLEGDSRACWLLVGSPTGVLYRSLPLSSDPTCAECTLAVRVGPSGKLEVKVAMAPDRRVGRALHGLIETGKLGLGVDLAKEAIKLVAGNHADPISAAYSGLLLQRSGLLEDHAEQVEKLARDFPWIPDGRILHAALLSRGRRLAQVRRGHELLLEATRSSPLFSDAFSLALALLRRWPDEAGEAERRTRLEALTGTIAHFDFTSTFATMQWSRTELAARTTAATSHDSTSEVHPEVLRWHAELIVQRYVARDVPPDQILDQFAADNSAVVEQLGRSGLAALLQVLRTDHDVDLEAVSAWPLAPDSYTSSDPDLEEREERLEAIEAIEAIRDESVRVGATLVARHFGPAGRLSPAEEARWRSDYREDFEDRFREAFEEHLSN